MVAPYAGQYRALRSDTKCMRRQVRQYHTPGQDRASHSACVGRYGSTTYQVITGHGIGHA
eukprot:1312839-Rhodomonas_salina.1